MIFSIIKLTCRKDLRAFAMESKRTEFNERNPGFGMVRRGVADLQTAFFWSVCLCLYLFIVFIFVAVFLFLFLEGEGCRGDGLGL